MAVYVECAKKVATNSKQLTPAYVAVRGIRYDTIPFELVGENVQRLLGVQKFIFATLSGQMLR